MELLRKYGVQTDIYLPLIKRNSMDFALGADYTYSAGDVKISKDGGAAANPTNSPSAITMGNGAVWKLTLTATEMQAALIVVTLVDAATKAVEDQAILISTYGNSSAQHEFDLDNAAVTVGTNNDKTGYRLSATGVDDILDEALTEPASVFAWGSATLRNVVAWLGALSRNKVIQTDTLSTLRNDADSADISTATDNDDGSTYTRGEWS